MQSWNCSYQQPEESPTGNDGMFSRLSVTCLPALAESIVQSISKPKSSPVGEQEESRITVALGSVISAGGPTASCTMQQHNNNNKHSSSSDTKRSNGNVKRCGVHMEPFSDAKALWATQHNQISLQHDRDTVLLFRACCQHLGPHATAAGRFRGSCCYEKDRGRMMWFDTSFLVSTQKSCWGTKPGREVVVAIWVKRSFLEECLGKAVCSDTFGPPESSGSSAAAAAASSGGRLKSIRSLRSWVSSGNLSDPSSEPGSDVFASPTAGRSPMSLPPQSAGDFFALGCSALAEGDCLTGGRAAAAAAAGAGKGRHGRKVFLGGGDGNEAGGWGEGHQGGRAEGKDGDGPRQRALNTSNAGDDAAVWGTPGHAASEVGLEGLEGGGEHGSRACSHDCSRTACSGVGSWSKGSVGGSKQKTDSVRLHWEPERLPSGEKHRTRRVVQLGLKGKWLHDLGSGEAVVKIQRLDKILAEQRKVLESSEPQLLMVPVARPLDCGFLTGAQLEALHLVSESARPKLRILCLHGYLQNAQVFSHKTRQLCKKLRPTAELFYVDAPHLLAQEELPPPLPSLDCPRAEVAEVATKAAAAAVAKVLTSGEGGAPGTMGGKAKAKTGTTGYGDSDSHLASPGTSDTDSMSASLLSLTSQTTEQSDADVQAAAATAAQGEGTAGAAADGSVVNDREGARTWWRCDAEERRIAKAAPGMSGRCEWKGLEESLAYLCEIWDEQGPFDGILGFSQGAAMAAVFHHCLFGSCSSLLGRGLPGDKSPTANGGSGIENGGSVADDVLHLVRKRLLSPPTFAVFVSGCFQPHPSQVPTYPPPQEASQEDLPSLHVWAAKDPFVPAAQSQRLAGMYLRPSVLMHRGSHYVPQGKNTIPHIIRFLEEFR